VARSDLDSAKKAIEDIRGQIHSESVFVREDIAEVSVVGVGMRSHCGVAEKMFKALSVNKVNIDSITTREIRISCLVDLADAERALIAVCDAFELDKPADQRAQP
jgi:aspartate kinase